MTEVAGASLPNVSVVLAHAVDWPDDNLHAWLAGVRRAAGPRKPLLALLPRPPESYPAETQALWTRAYFAFGVKLGQTIEAVEDFLAGRA